MIRSMKRKSLSRRTFIVCSVVLMSLVSILGLRIGPVAAEPIKIGASISLSGKYAQTGLHFRRGYELWREQVNARGGLMGRPVEFVILDDKSDPTTGARLYEKLITLDKVDLVLGPYSSAVTFAVSTVTEKYKYPMLAAGASSAKIWQRGYRYVFMVVTPGENYLDGAIDIAKQKGAKRVAIINADSLYPKTWAKSAVEKVKGAGLELVFHEEFPEKPTDLSAILIKVKSANPEVLLCGTYFNDAVLITRQMKELGVNVKILAQTVGPSLPQFSENLGSLANYVYGASQWEAISTLKFPGMADFVAAFEKKHSYTPTYQAAESYGSMQVLEQAVKNIGSLDHEKLRAELARLQTTTIFGPYKVDDQGRQVAKTMLLVQWQDGKRNVVWPAKVAPNKPLFPTPLWDNR